MADLRHPPKANIEKVRMPKGAKADFSTRLGVHHDRFPSVANHAAQNQHRQGMLSRKGAMADLPHPPKPNFDNVRTPKGAMADFSTRLGVHHDRLPSELVNAVELGEPTISSPSTSCTRVVQNVLRCNPRLAVKFSRLQS